MKTSKRERKRQAVRIHNINFDRKKLADAKSKENRIKQRAKELLGEEDGSNDT